MVGEKDGYGRFAAGNTAAALRARVVEAVTVEQITAAMDALYRLGMGTSEDGAGDVDALTAWLDLVFAIEAEVEEDVE